MLRESLQNARVLRGGVTARYLSLETVKVVCQATEKVELRFEMSSKGGGTTAVLLEFGSQDFATLTKAMCAVDRQSAMNTMAAELAREVTRQPEQDAALILNARKSVVHLAQKKMHQAPFGDDDAERLILKGVVKLVEELSRKKKQNVKAA